VRECITTPTFFIALKGSIAGFFQRREGLKEGEPPITIPFCLRLGSLLKNTSKQSPRS